MEESDKWYSEALTPDILVHYRIKNVLYTGRTAYQTVEVVDTFAFRRSLILDGKTQSTEADEYIYHEALVHPALVFHGRPERVFIGGGGEGATLREVLSHQSAKHVVMADIDPEVVDICQRFLPGHHLGAFGDSRVELIHQDARQFLASCQEAFDVIILDLVDPIEGGPSYLLYTQEFYQIARAKLKPGGTLITQAGPAGPLNCQECFTAIVHTLSTVFPKVCPYTVFVPSFLTQWGFALVSTEGDAQQLDPGVIEDYLSQKVSRPLKFYDGTTHLNMFSLPKYLRLGIKDETRIVTDKNPVFMP